MGFSSIAKLLAKVTKVDQGWQWDPKQEQAFQELKV